MAKHRNLVKISTKIMVSFIDTIFSSMIDAFKGVLIGLELRECPMRSVSPR